MFLSLVQNIIDKKNEEMMKDGIAHQNPMERAFQKFNQNDSEDGDKKRI